MKRLVQRFARSLGCELRTLPPFDVTPAAGTRRPTLEWCLEQTAGMLAVEEAKLLYELARDVQVGVIVEVGSFRGRSTVTLGRGSLDGFQVPVYAIDPHEVFHGVLGGEFGPQDRGAFFEAMLSTGCYWVVRLVNLSSEIVAPNWQAPVALLWIDGDHSYYGVRRDFDCWYPQLTSTATVAFDDSTDPRLGPRQVINEIIAGGEFSEVAQVGKVTVLRRQGQPGTTVAAPRDSTVSAT